MSLDVVTCGGCGTEFGVDARRLKELRETGETFYCPNGHARVYTVGKTDEEKKIERLELALREAWQRSGSWAEAHREALRTFRRCPLCNEVVTRSRDEDTIVERIADHLRDEHGARARMRALTAGGAA